MDQKLATKKFVFLSCKRDIPVDGLKITCEWMMSDFIHQSCDFGVNIFEGLTSADMMLYGINVDLYCYDAAPSIETIFKQE